MHRTRPAIGTLALPLLLAAVLCAGCGALPAATETSTPAAALPTAPIVSLPATWTPDVRPEAASTVAAARLTPYATPSLMGFTLALDATPPDGPAPLTVTFRARATGSGSPGCVGELWDFGDGDGWWVQVACGLPYPLDTPTPTPTTPVTTEYRVAHTYRQPGTYRATFCPAQGAMCLLSATTTVMVR